MVICRRPTGARTFTPLFMLETLVAPPWTPRLALIFLDMVSSSRCSPFVGLLIWPAVLRLYCYRCCWFSDSGYLRLRHFARNIFFMLLKSWSCFVEKYLCSWGILMALAGTKLNSGREHLRDLAGKEKRVCIGFTRLVSADALADSCSYISSLVIFYVPKRLKIVEVLRAGTVVIMELRA